MIYKDFQNLKLSSLGMGAMRLPVLNNDDSQIDYATTKEMVDYAIKKGINYFDTAWGYHAGQSEIAIGKALNQYPRESYFLATKFPGYDLNNMTKVEEIFEKQLEKCQVDYFDFYLFHNVCEMNIDAYLDDEKYGIYTYLMKQKKNGRIKHLGFSAHGNIQCMKKFLDVYGKDMEFCQIQLNWLDYGFQDAKGKIELLKHYHLPIWVMEPLRGGKLCTLTKDNEDILKQLRPQASMTSWAFRFLQSIPEVTMVLSGMSNRQQMIQNIETFETDEPLNEKEMFTLLDIGHKMTNQIALPCTSCRYCTTHCPMELDIPHIISLYNEHAFTGGGFIAPMALSAIPLEKQPSSCIGCKSCEAVCPQQIQISKMMRDFVEKMK